MNIHKDEEFEFIEEGNGTPIVLLHGLFGALSNWEFVIERFADRYKVIIPLLPIAQSNSVGPSLVALAGYVMSFLLHRNLEQIHLIGNSLGGQLGLIVSLKDPKRFKTLVLTGSSGLFEEGMGSTYPKRGDYNYVKERVEFTFYSPETASKDLVDETYEIVNNPSKAIRIIKLARDAQNANMREQIKHIEQKACLIWGLNDNITPTYVAHEFHRLIPNSELYFIDRCGHAPMMEQPERFNYLLEQFLAKNNN